MRVEKPLLATAASILLLLATPIPVVATDTEADTQVSSCSDNLIEADNLLKRAKRLDSEIAKLTPGKDDAEIKSLTFTASRMRLNARNLKQSCAPPVPIP